MLQSRNNAENAKILLKDLLDDANTMFPITKDIYYEAQRLGFGETLATYLLKKVHKYI